MWFSRIDAWPRNVEHAHERVADHGGAEVPDVHLLGDVGRRVVDDDRARGRAAGATPSRSSAATSASCAARKRSVEREVDEARPGDLDRAAHGAEHTAVDDLLGDLAWVAAELLGERQGAVDLGVGAVGRAHHRVDGDIPVRTPGDPSEYRREQVGDEGERVGHVAILARPTGVGHERMVRQWIGRTSHPTSRALPIWPR